MDGVRADFDRIALLGERYGGGHNERYHGFLLRQLRGRFGEALEIGCGTGAFSRALAARSEHVLAIDLSPEMIRVARERSSGCGNVDFEVGDALEWEFSKERFECIASIATLHHLPMERMLMKMKAALKAGGTLMVLDLYKARDPLDFLVSAAAVPVDLGLRLTGGRLVAPREVREAWEEHGRHDTYLTLWEVRRICAR